MIKFSENFPQYNFVETAYIDSKSQIGMAIQGSELSAARHFYNDGIMRLQKFSCECFFVKQKIVM